MYLQRMRFFCLFFLFLPRISLFAQPGMDSLLIQVLVKNNNPVFQQVLHDPQTYRLQIIYTEINRDKHNNHFLRIIITTTIPTSILILPPR